MSAASALDDLSGALALPRSNGELVFSAPWEGRAFGIAVGLSEAGLLDWDEFRAELTEQIAVASEDRPYYDSWLAALEVVTMRRALVDRAELRVREHEFLVGSRDEVH